MNKRASTPDLGSSGATKSELECAQRVVTETIATRNDQEDALRAVLIMRRQLESSRDSDVSSRSVHGHAALLDHDELLQHVDGYVSVQPGATRSLRACSPADPMSRHNQSSIQEVMPNNAQAPAPRYDTPDAVEEIADITATDWSRTWRPVGPSSAKQISKNGAIVQPVRILSVAPKSGAATAMPTSTSGDSNSRSAGGTSAPQLFQAAKDAIVHSLDKIMYDAADAVTETVDFNSSSAPGYWQSVSTRYAGQFMKQQAADVGSLHKPVFRNVAPSPKPRTTSLAPDRATAPSDNPLTTPGMGERGGEATRNRASRNGQESTVPGPASPKPAKLVTHRRASETHTTSNRTTSTRSTHKSSRSPVQIFIQQPQAPSRNDFYGVRAARRELPRSSTQYRRLGRPRHGIPTTRRHAGGSILEFDDNDDDLQSRSRSRTAQSLNNDESLTSLQVATQSLDRALINLNGLLDEAMSMIDHATSSGRHGEVINIINATNDSFRTAKVRRPDKAHLHQQLLTRIQGSSITTSLDGSVHTSTNDTMIVHPSGTPRQVFSGNASDAPVSPRSHPANDRERLGNVQAAHADEAGPPSRRISDPTGFIMENTETSQPAKPHKKGSSIGSHAHNHKHRPIARDWDASRKRMTAIIACCNTFSVGLLAGIYAGEVPGIQYRLADLNHRVVLGNVLLYIGIAITTMLFWPLPLLHGRKPYTVAAFAIMLPLQYPQALAVQSFSDPDSAIATVGLLLPRALTGLAIGFANINFLPTLLDLYGASLMSEIPHQEHVDLDDVRRQGGGIGLWLGIWTWCYIGSLSIGFCIGACIIYGLTPDWGFYITIMLLAVFLFINIVAPETRQAPHRQLVIHVCDHEYKLNRRVANSEVHLHLYQTGPQWWFEEVWAGIVMSFRMITQAGFFVMNLYFAWIYAQIVLVIILLGALLSRYYVWSSYYVGLASLALALGALFAVPLTHGGFCSRSRSHPPRTNSMTLRHGGIKWTSHMLRRCLFTLVLPLAGLAFTLTSPGPRLSWVMPVVFVGLVGFLSNLAMTECIGLIMETFDTCDLQAGVNNRHRENSLPDNIQKVRTHYSAFPRICAGIFASQSLGFLLAAAATGVSGSVTRAIGAQISTACVAGILLVLTILLLLVLVRWHTVQIVPDGLLRTSTMSIAPWIGAEPHAVNWRPVILGNPSSKKRRMNLLETGKMTRWSEIRRLNGLEK